MKLSAHDLVFENVFQTRNDDIRTQAIRIWRQSPLFDEKMLHERAEQLVFVAKTNLGEVVAMSTAYKAYVNQFKNHFYLFRCLVTNEYRMPGLDTKLTVLTRDFLETIYKSDPDEVVGMMAIIQHPRLKEIRDATWPTTKLTYLGNTRDGDHIRVYYFSRVNIRKQ